MKQDTWQPLNDKWSRPNDKDGIFLGYLKEQGIRTPFTEGSIFRQTELPLYS